MRARTESISNEVLGALTFKPRFGFRLCYLVAGPRRVEHPITGHRSGADMTNDLWETESIELPLFSISVCAKEAGETFTRRYPPSPGNKPAKNKPSIFAAH